LYISFNFIIFKKINPTKPKIIYAKSVPIFASWIYLGFINAKLSTKNDETILVVKNWQKQAR